MSRMSQDRDAAPVQSTTLEAELVSSGRGEGDPGSRLCASLPCPDLSTPWNGVIVCRKPQPVRARVRSLMSPQRTSYVQHEGGRNEDDTRANESGRSGGGGG
jgi:hypothetical protein